MVICREERSTRPLDLRRKEGDLNESTTVQGRRERGKHMRRWLDRARDDNLSKEMDCGRRKCIQSRPKTVNVVGPMPTPRLKIKPSMSHRRSQDICWGAPGRRHPAMH